MAFHGRNDLNVRGGVWDKLAQHLNNRGSRLSRPPHHAWARVSEPDCWSVDLYGSRGAIRHVAGVRGYRIGETQSIRGYQAIGHDSDTVSPGKRRLFWKIGTMAYMSKAEFGTFDDLVQLAKEPLRPIMTRLRAIIFEIHPDSCEVVRLGDRAATYGLGPRKMIDGYTYILPYNAWVNLGVYRGAELADPEGLLEGTGAKMRHVKMRSIKDAERPAVRGLIEEALAERRTTLGRLPRVLSYVGKTALD